MIPYTNLNLILTPIFICVHVHIAFLLARVVGIGVGRR